MEKYLFRVYYVDLIILSHEFIICAIPILTKAKDLSDLQRNFIGFAFVWLRPLSPPSPIDRINPGQVISC